MADDAQSLIRDYQYLWSQQANFRTLWNTIAQFVMPAWDNFIGELSEGIIRTSRLFDSRAVTANERFASIMESLLTPRTQMWHDIVPGDENLRDNADVQDYCSRVRRILFTARYRPMANFASQTDECYMQLGAFGNNALLVDELAGKHLLYRSIPLSELVWALNMAGMVDEVYRKYCFTAKQCYETWGDKCSPGIKKEVEKSPFKEFDILHVVKPNAERKVGAIGPKGMKYSSFYLVVGEKHMLQEGGYRSFPYAIGRYRMAPREHYGRSPGSVALPAIRTLNEQKKTALRAGQKAVDPPLLLNDEGALTPFNLRAGALNYGTLSEDGTPLVQALESKANFQIGKELMDMESMAVDDAFLTSVLQILAQNPGMTATEALIRSQEKGILIAPAMGRQQSEFLGPMIVREVDILSRAGQLPPPPPELIASGQGIKIEYTAPLAKLLRAEEAQTIMQSVQGIAQVMSIKPSVGDNIDWDKTTREYLEASGFPMKLIVDPDDVAAKRAQDAQAAQEQATMTAAPGVSQSALNLAKAHQALTQPAQGASSG